MWDIWYIKDNKRTEKQKEKKRKEIVDHQFRKQNLRKGGTDRQKDNIVSFIKDVIYK